MSHLTPEQSDLIKLIKLIEQEEVSLDMIKFAISRVGDVNFGVDRENPLLHSCWDANSCNPELFKLLISSGADPNYKSSHNLTPLMFTLAMGALDLSKLLIEKGADPTVKHHDKDIRYFAKHSKSAEVIKYAEELVNSTKINQIRLENEKLRDKITTYELAFVDLDKQFKNTEVKNEKLRLLHTQALSANSTANEIIKQLQNDIDKLNRDQNAYTYTLKEQYKTIDFLKNTLAENKKYIDKLNKDNAVTIAECEHSKQELAVLVDASQTNGEDLQKQIERAISEIEALEHMVCKLEETVKELQQTIVDNENENEMLHEEIAKLSGRCTDYCKQIDIYESEMIVMERTDEYLREELAKLSHEIEDKERTNTDLRDMLDKMQINLEEVTAEHGASFEALLAEYNLVKKQAEERDEIEKRNQEMLKQSEIDERAYIDLVLKHDELEKSHKELSKELHEQKENCNNLQFLYNAIESRLQKLQKDDADRENLLQTIEDQQYELDEKDEAYTNLVRKFNEINEKNKELLKQNAKYEQLKAVLFDNAQ